MKSAPDYYLPTSNDIESFFDIEQAFIPKYQLNLPLDFKKEHTANSKLGSIDQKYEALLHLGGKQSDPVLESFCLSLAALCTNDYDDRLLLAYASHELRPPMTVIKGYSDFTFGGFWKVESGAT